jgi:hypothetical protein
VQAVAPHVLQLGNGQAVHVVPVIRYPAAQLEQAVAVHVAQPVLGHAVHVVPVL